MARKRCRNIEAEYYELLEKSQKKFYNLGKRAHKCGNRKIARRAAGEAESLETSLAT